ncbi:MAG: hypothetical protein Q4B09_05420 [Lachnospiraceae bacterium]|nr:hypothetical protein [Lachnospiraceae bacterium]
MSYTRINWKDHIVERPKTYDVTHNEDDTVTLAESNGHVHQQGTPLSANNFNKMDEALQHISIAFDMYVTQTQAQIRSLQSEIEDLKKNI